MYREQFLGMVAGVLRVPVPVPEARARALRPVRAVADLDRGRGIRRDGSHNATQAGMGTDS